MTLSPRLRTAARHWAAAYPTITALLFVLDPLLGSAPLLVRTLLLTAIMIPAMQFVVVPLLDHLAPARSGGAGGRRRSAR